MASRLFATRIPESAVVTETLQRRTLDAANRAAVVGVAERYGFRVIEDDPYAELRYSGRPVPSMATMIGTPAP